MGRYAWFLIAAACGRSDLYAPCDAPDDCAAPDGVTAECLDKSGAGFCTWACEVDLDCAFDQDAYDRVCASFQSEDGLHCFPSCEPTADAEEVACPDGFECRSTGGGSDNRKVCFPSTPATTEPTR